MSEGQPIQTGPPLPAESGDVNYALAAVAGVAAAAASAGIWFGIFYYTDTMLGIIAIGVGFLVGFAVKMGAGNRGAFGLQILGAILALLAIIAGDYLSLNHMVRQQWEGFEGWLGLQDFIEVYKAFIADGPVTLLFYAIAIYEGYILPKPESAAEIVIPD